MKQTQLREVTLKMQHSAILIQILRYKLESSDRCCSNIVVLNSTQKQICSFLARHEKTCFSTYKCNKFAPFWRVTRKVIEKQWTGTGAMRKPAFPLKNATNLHLFWRVTRKPTFPLKNAANLHLFGASRENLLFHLKMQQICTFLARHEKTCFST